MGRAPMAQAIGHSRQIYRIAGLRTACDASYQGGQGRSNEHQPEKTVANQSDKSQSLRELGVTLIWTASMNLIRKNHFHEGRVHHMLCYLNI